MDVATISIHGLMRKCWRSSIITTVQSIIVIIAIFKHERSVNVGAVFTDLDSIDDNPHTLSTSECHAVGREATQPKNKNDNDTVNNYIYDIDEQGDALSNEMCDRGSHDNDILNERIRTTLPNGVSGVVGSPTRIDFIDTAGCNADILTASDADNGGAGCNAEKLAMSDASIGIDINDIHIHDHRKCDTRNDTHDKHDKLNKRKQ
jgi:hypothetical protein